MTDISTFPMVRLACRRRGLGVLLMLAIGLLPMMLVGCATWDAPAPVGAAELRARAVTETVSDVRLSAAVLGAADSRQRFGADVNATDIQPVWVEVQNDSRDVLWLLHAGTDPEYFSPLEVAWSFHSSFGGANNAAIDEHFNALAFKNPIPRGATRSGVIFANPHHRTRVLNVDLIGRHRLIPFTLFVPVPDDPPDSEATQLIERYSAVQPEDLHDPNALRAALARLPCCGTSADGMEPGDPVNLVWIGAFTDIGAALQRRGFRSEREAIDDAQRLFGRRPDIVGRKVGRDGMPAHWVRLWVAPLRYRGQPVYLSQVGRPMGGRTAVGDDDDLVLHPNVDEARNLLVQDLFYSGGLAKLGFVEGSGAVEVARAQETPADSRYHTDGLRAVVFFVTRPLALSDVELLDWTPYLARRATDAAATDR